MKKSDPVTRSHLLITLLTHLEKNLSVIKRVFKRHLDLKPQGRRDWNLALISVCWFTAPCKHPQESCISALKIKKPIKEQSFRMNTPHS